MNKRTDQQLQEFLDVHLRSHGTASSTAPDEEEMQAYKRLFDGLSAEPADMFLPYSFAATLARMVQRKAQNRREIKTFVLYGLGLCIALLITASILYTAPDNAYILLEKGFLRLAIPLFVTLTGFGLIQLADYWLIKRIRS
ncbi:hypothetical protein GCM10028805_17030 [Spirosoma harenae]